MHSSRDSWSLRKKISISHQIKKIFIHQETLRTEKTHLVKQKNKT